MQILTGTKREITLKEWDECLKKAEKRLADSEKCYEIFGDEDDKERVEEDRKKVEEIKKHIEEVIAFMDANNIK